jgi:DHA1 family multidrug resistance protein-like MFS transporter
MSALIRDAPIGQIVRWVTKNKILQYPEEKPDFSLPSTHAIFRDEAHPLPLVEPERPHTGETVTAPEPGTALELEPKRTHESSGDDDDDTIDLEKMKTAGTMRTSRTGLSRLGTRTAFSQSHTRADLEQKFSAATLERGPTLPIAPEKLDDGTILVDWYTTDDEENPQNWSFGKKAFVSLQI